MYIPYTESYYYICIVIENGWMFLNLRHHEWYGNSNVLLVNLGVSDTCRTLDANFDTKIEYISRNIYVCVCVYIYTQFPLGYRMKFRYIGFLLKTNCLPKYFLQWLYFAYSWVPGGKIWLCWWLGVKKYRAWTIIKSVGYSTAFGWALWLCKISIFTVPHHQPITSS